MNRPFDVITAKKDTPIFIFGDHASRHIPAEFSGLGLSGEDLTRHIAWDIGTETVIRELCDIFGCGAQIAQVSRLVIDLNRDPSAPGLIPIESDSTIIPGNQNLTPAQRQARIGEVYAPYHSALAQTLAQTKPALTLSIHSFTPQIAGQPMREVDIGLLVKHDVPTAERFVAKVEAATDYDIRINEPYSAYDLNYTVDAHVAPLSLRHLAIEIRQDHISSDRKAKVMARTLAPMLHGLIEETSL